MNVAIDISPLKSGHKDRGVGKYTKLLIESLQKYEPKHSYTFFERGQNVPENAEVVHYPFFDPFFLTLPMVKSKPTVVTVHDLIPLVFPDRFPRGIRGEVKWQIQKLALKKATKVITDSENSKKDIVKITGFPNKNVSVVYLAPDPAIVAGSIKKEAERFFIYVGDLNWNKNIHGLLAAFAKVPKDIDLVIVGRAFLDEKLPEAIAVGKYVQKQNLEGRVKFLGFVSDQKLGVLYASSLGCVLPSYYEGFGLPILEAMACGTPVIASFGSSLDEIAGPAIRVDAQNPNTIADGMAKLLALSHVERQKLIQKGKEWVSKFTWEKVARDTVRVYESCI